MCAPTRRTNLNEFLLGLGKAFATFLRSLSRCFLILPFLDGLKFLKCGAVLQTQFDVHGQEDQPNAQQEGYAPALRP